MDIHPSLDSAKIMAAIDRQPAAMRELVYEYGFVIVRDMINDGYRDPVALRPLLETWRQRRQDAWLNGSC